MDEKVYSDDTINPETGENSDINNENEEQTVAEDIETYDEGSGGLNRNYVVPGIAGDGSLSGMYRNWFLDYASYVILDRAVPHIEDGLKPVQRRILHSMQTLDDGRFNKVANIVGNTMQYHPHGDASIGDAIVQLGQKELLIDTQGNWGNILTGDSAAAPRYIEARLSPFALETLYSPKVTEWTRSYDGRKDEPVTLPAKFPIVLAQGVEGIAVGLSSKILPHNFNEILDACIACLRGKPFTLLPDFQTGGLVDASRYNDGARGGSVRVRAKIEKIDNKTLAITELPYSKTTATLIQSIISAMDKGKIKIRKVDDNTAATAMILVHLQPGTSSDKAIDALYAFTDCEVKIWPNCCVIKDQRPQFINVSQLVAHSVEQTRNILYRELEIKLDEKREERYNASLEKIFISERMYKNPQVEEAGDMEKVVVLLHELFTPWKESLEREITDGDLERLWEVIRMKRVLKFNVEKAEEKIAQLTADIEETTFNMEHIDDFTENWYRHLKDSYGNLYPRRTELRSFENIEATKVAEANKRLYYDKTGGFLGTALKEGEFKCNCSDIDDILFVNKDGTYKIVRTPEKLFVGKKVIYVAPFKKGDDRTTYNVIYTNGKGGITYKKRFHITGLARDKEYNITKGLPGSVMHYFSANPNGEAEIVTVIIKDPKDDLKLFKRNSKSDESLIMKEVNFAELAIKGKDTLGNLVTKYKVKEVKFSESLGSTLSGREVWFDHDVLRINYDGRGESLGVFEGNDKVLVITKNGEFYTTSYSDDNHFNPGILSIQKFNPEKVFTAAFFDKASQYTYLKRFCFEPATKPQPFVNINDDSKLYLLTDAISPLLGVEFGGHDRNKAPIEIAAAEFIGVKSYKAKGKRLSNFKVRSVALLSTGEENTDENEEREESEESVSERVVESVAEGNTDKTTETNQAVAEELMKRAEELMREGDLEDNNSVD